MLAAAYSLDELRKKRPRYLVVLLSLYGLLSSIIAFSHLFAIERKWAKIPSCFAETTDGPYFTIRKIWLARMLRRSLSLFLRTPLRNGYMSLINFNLILPQESGCIITICHTPWARLLAEWCRVNKFALVLVGGPWIKRTRRVNIPGGGLVGLRRLVQHLRSGGRVIVIGDNIGRSRCCSVNFLGKECMASILLLFFVGAPLGAIIRKGGMGLPMVVAIVLFLTYHFIGIFAKNSAEDGTMHPFIATWVSTVIMLPLSIWLTHRATTDQGVMDIDAFTQRIVRLFKKEDDLISEEEEE